ncbi:MAG: gamma-glutamylcyclotransferase [Pseudomonadota bacterium]
MALTPVFLFGTLRDRDLLQVVAGGDLSVEEAELPGFRVARAEGHGFPILDERAGKAARGVLITPDAAQLARLDYYEAPYEYTRVPVTVETAAGQVEAEVYAPQPGQWRPGGPWSLSHWQDEHGALMREAAVEIMAGHGHVAPALINARFCVILTRAQQRLNARARPSPVVLRRPHTRADVEVVAQRQAYSHFFALEDVQLRARQFDGGWSEVMDRAVFVTADAVTVLPYDPVRDRVLLIEQFRAATYMRGDPNPWSLEVIAGRQDAGESLHDAVRREAKEEAGLTLGELHEVSRYYSSPGAHTEYLTSFIGIADLPDGTDGVGGLESEAEDIRSMLVSFDTLMEALDTGEAENGPLILSALWLARKRDALRAAMNG